MNKLIIALASLAGIAVKGDETEDQLEAAIKAHQPAGQKFEMNLDDPETKKLFDTAVTAGITAAVKPFEAKITALEALIKNGPAASAGAGTPVVGAAAGGSQNKSKDDQIADLQEQINACSDSVERGKLVMQIRALRAAK